MRFKLWQKMALMFVAIAVTVILVVFLVVNLAFERRFQNYIDSRQEITNGQLIQALATIYAGSNGWDEEASRNIPHLAFVNGVKLKVVDAKGRIIARPSEVPEGGNLLRTGKTVKLPIVVSNRTVGFAYITPTSDLFGIPREDINFRTAINRVVFFGGLAAIAVSLLLSFAVSTRLTMPLEIMTEAAEKMEAGDLKQRVTVKSRDEIGDLAAAFNHLAAALERQESLRRNLTADIAHELRTPLATIQSHIEAYLDGVMTPDKKNIESIHEEILRLSRLVGDLGEIANLESGKVNINKTDADLNDLAERVVANIKPLFNEKNVALELNIAADKLPVKVDSDKIHQVLYNLLFNALKFTPGGGRTVVALERDESRAILSVSDTGIGIAAADLPLVFERFYRVDKSRNRASGGAGIGLTLVKELTEAHGGSVSVTSEEGSGTRFEIILPLV